MKRALLLVDVQPTFCEGGALAVEGGNAVAERIARYVAEQGSNYDLIATSQDWHIEPGDHFATDPDFIDTWPPHGVAGTPEAELHPALASLRADISVKKGHYSAAYSAFEGVTEDEGCLSDGLRAAQIEALDVVGIAESHCVLQSCLDAVEEGWPVRCLSDLTVPVSEDLGAAARERMREAGVELVDSSQAFPGEGSGGCGCGCR
ncbi:MAG: isochorismatase family protein [Bowdeniella nasicola]|nr:isochorismatase family protein [Bowdeniella nasicola]